MNGGPNTAPDDRPASGRWWRDIDRSAWRSLFAAGAGWMLDGMDVMLYTFALTAISEEFHLSKGQAGAVASVTLIASACGGLLAGLLADRIGRVRALMLSITIYSVFTGLAATSQSLWQLIFWRTLVGLGMGGEWAAGSVLVAESWPARHRGKAIGLMQSGWAIGVMIAAVLSAIVLPHGGWRMLFVLGVAPAIVVIWIRRELPESHSWKRARTAEPGTRAVGLLLKPPLLGKVITASSVATVLMFAYWGLFTWIPTYLSAPRAEGGAGLSVFKSLGWILPVQLGAFLGYASFGFFADWFGRRPAFIAFVLGAAIIVPIYGLSARSEWTLMILGPLVGFFAHGYFSIFGAMLAELFPPGVRGTAQGLCYNLGRGAGAAAPWMIGAIAQSRGIGPALALTSVLYVVGAAMILLLPETKGKEIE